MPIDHLILNNKFRRILFGVAIFVGLLTMQSIVGGEALKSEKSSFEKIKRLPLGTTQAHAESIFGRPSKVYRVRATGDIVWQYIVGSDVMHRMEKQSLVFSGRDHTLVGVNYYPESPDKAALASGLKAEFPNANFKTVQPSSCGQHFTLNEGFDYDLALGITVRKDDAGRVASLSFSKPLSEKDRKTASEPTGCPNLKEPNLGAIEITPALK